MANNGISLDPYDRHLDLELQDENVATCMHTHGLQYLWKGGRATAGVRSGKYMYEVKVLEDLPAKMPDTPPKLRDIARVGFSLPLTELFLGDTPASWGFGGTGKKSHNNQYDDYGSEYDVGNVIGCIVDLDAKQISFTKDGQFLGTAFTDLPESIANQGIFPHVFSKNVKVQCNFARETKWFDPPGAEVKFFDEAPPNVLVQNPVERPQSHAECEFTMLVGLSGSGKTYWAESELARHPTKNYAIIGTNAVIDQMKVMKLARQRNYSGRWEELYTQAKPIFDQLCEVAADERTTPRHVMLDQTNVYKSARMKKAAPFAHFGKKRCVVFVCDDDEQQRRQEKLEAEEGKFIPEEVHMEMMAHFELPGPDEGYDEILYACLPEAEAKQQVQRMKEYAKHYNAAGGGKSRRPKPPLEKRHERKAAYAKA